MGLDDGTVQDKGKEMGTTFEWYIQRKDKQIINSN